MLKHCCSNHCHPANTTTDNIIHYINRVASAMSATETNSFNILFTPKLKCLPEQGGLPYKKDGDGLWNL